MDSGLSACHPKRWQPRLHGSQNRLHGVLRVAGSDFREGEVASVWGGMRRVQSPWRNTVVDPGPVATGRWDANMIRRSSLAPNVALPTGVRSPGAAPRLHARWAHRVL